MAPPTTEKRRRRRPEEAEREILEAAESVLRERPFRELTVEHVMDRTTMSRPSFYVHFRDRNVLLGRLAGEVLDDLAALMAGWMESSADPVAAMRTVLGGAARIFAENGRLLVAIADAAAHDADAEQIYQDIISRFTTLAVAKLEQELKAGNVELRDPERTASALVRMTEKTFTESLAREEQDDPEAVTEALLEVWVRTLYLRGV